MPRGHQTSTPTALYPLRGRIRGGREVGVIDECRSTRDVGDRGRGVPPPPRQPHPHGAIPHRHSAREEATFLPSTQTLSPRYCLPPPCAAIRGYRHTLARPRDDGSGQPQKTFAAAVIFRYQTMSSWFGGLASGYRFHRVDLLSRHPLAGVQYPDCGRPGGGVPHEIRTMKVFARRYLTPRPSRRERCKPPAGIQFPAKPPQDRAAPSIALAILIHLRHRDV